MKIFLYGLWVSIEIIRHIEFSKDFNINNCMLKDFNSSAFGLRSQGNVIAENRKFDFEVTWEIMFYRCWVTQTNNG